MRILAEGPLFIVVVALRIILLLLLLDNHVVNSFHIQRPISRIKYQQQNQQQHYVLSSSSWINDDYEYIANENANTSRDSTADDSSSLLTSAYPPSTPSGLRGEAVRSALKSSRCIAWSFSSSSSSSNNDNNNKHHRHPLASGLLRVHGTGCVNFLNNKLSQSFATNNNSNNKKKSSNSFKQGALLTSKGAIVDQLGVAIVSSSPDDEQQAFIWTSPGHDSHDLFQRLNKYIFPLDKVALQDCCSNEEGDNKDTSNKKDDNSVMLESCFALASLQLEHVQDVFDKWIQPKLVNVDDKKIQLPQHDECRLVKLDADDSLLILPTVSLNPSAAVGCTFLFLANNKNKDKNNSKKSNNNNRLGQEIWSTLVDDNNHDGPIAIGSLEWETLRIEAGVPRFGYEMTAATLKTSSSIDTTSPTATAHITDATATTPIVAASTKPALPLELHLQHLIDVDKGCYLGQEGVVSVVKNIRGPPRTLHQIEWHDEFNLYNYQSTFDDKNKKDNDNETRIPKCGDVLYVLGSNQQIPVGTVTSVAEPGGTGEAVTLGLALIRRADGILSKMEKLELEMPKQPSLSLSFDDTPSPSIAAAAAIATTLDPLDGLEVIIGDSYTIGTLRTVPSRRGPNYHLFHDDNYQDKSARVTDISVPGVPAKVHLYEPASSISSSSSSKTSKSVTQSSLPVEKEPVVSRTILDTENENNQEEDEAEQLLKQAVEEASQAQAKAEAAVAEAKRKEEKMKLLQERAAQAMAARRKKSTPG